MQNLDNNNINTNSHNNNKQDQQKQKHNQISYKLCEMQNDNVFKSMIITLVQDQQMMEDYFLLTYQDPQNKNNKIQTKHCLIENKQQNIHTQNQTITNQQQIHFINITQNQLIQCAQQTQNVQIKQQLKQILINKNKQINQIQKKHQLIKNNQLKITRLQLQKQKNKLAFIQVFGQIFIYLAQTKLLGRKQQQGLLLITNYRIIFFKTLPTGTKKRVDLPYGFIKQIQYTSKRKQIIFHLHYLHSWKFYILHQNDYQKIRKMLTVYGKNQKNNFAYAYAEKYFTQNPLKNKVNFDILIEYNRTRLSEIALIFPNQNYKLSSSYPSYICIPQTYIQSTKDQIYKIAQNYVHRRLPVLIYRYFQTKNWAQLWISGTYIEQNPNNSGKRLNISQVKKYLQKISIQKTNKLNIFDCYYKSVRSICQSNINENKFKNTYLNLPVNSQIRTSYNLIVEAYLNPKQNFISSVLNSKWYQNIFNIIDKSFLIVQCLMRLQNVLIKQDQIDKTPQLTSLVQIILQPYYRTFEGFKNLIMKDFICFGHKFASRLGNRQVNQQYPIFVQFLDCVSQLINLNPESFQFNYKYLSKLSNLMYTNIFGTFIANSPKQFFNQQILNKTVQIWNDIQNDLTRNAFYFLKNGILLRAYNFSNIRFWNEHFSYLTGLPKDIYKIHVLAQTPTDYINLECLKVKNENQALSEEITKQIEQIRTLKLEIQKKKSQRNQIQKKNV